MGGPEGGGSKGGSPRFFPSPAPNFRSLFLSGSLFVSFFLSLGSSRVFLVVLEAPGPSNVHVWLSGCRMKPQRPAGRRRKSCGGVPAFWRSFQSGALPVFLIQTRTHKKSPKQTWRHATRKKKRRRTDIQGEADKKRAEKCACSGVRTTAVVLIVSPHQNPTCSAVCVLLVVLLLMLSPPETRVGPVHGRPIFVPKPPESTMISQVQWKVSSLTREA